METTLSRAIEIEDPKVGELPNSGHPATAVKAQHEGRENAFGALRLLLATMVMFAHVPELLDGDRRREPITQLFHNGQSSGSLAVDGFFLISGYLISGSFVSDSRGYFLKRVLRIYPAFIVCSLVLIFIVGPLGGGSFPVGREWPRLIYRIAILQAPLSDGAFSRLHYPAPDVSMWTIAYEFRCYVLAAVFGFFGLYARPRLFLGLSLALLTLTLAPMPALPVKIEALIGSPEATTRLCAVFMIGICFRFIHISLNKRALLVVVPSVIALLLIKPIAEIAFVLLGGYIIFYVALKIKWGPLQKLNSKDDISYGIYLWAWPMSCLFLTFWPNVPLSVLLPADIIAAVLCGSVSWFAIEKPAMALRGRFLARREVVAKV